MEELVSTLEPLVPVIIVISLALLMTLESWLPFLSPGMYRKKQRWHNVGNLLLSFALNAGLSIIVSYSMTESTQAQFGLLYKMQLPFVVSLVIGILLSDLTSYAAHRLYHRLPFFWRIHRVHHSDMEVDASTALRLHPFEFIVMAFLQATVLPLLGVSNYSFVIYTAFSLPLVIFNHSNLKTARWYEKYVSFIFVTPGWHRVHHSSVQPETDSNFSDVFTFWDRIFGTARKRPAQEIPYGLETLREKEDQTFLGMLKTPFRPIK